MMTERRLYRALFNLLGISFCTIPVFLSIILYFPLWIRSDSGRFISGFCVLLLSLAALPLYRYIRKRLSDIPAYTIWLILFLICLIATRIIDELTVIALVGFLGNLIGALFFKAGERILKRNEQG